MSNMSDVYCPRFRIGDWVEWIQQFEGFALLKEWGDDKKLVALPLFLEDVARDTFSGLPEDIKANWTETCAALKEAFKPEDDSAAKRFLARKQMPGETVAIFAAALRCIGNVAYADHNTVTREKLFVKQFLRGLDSEVAEEAARKNPSKLVDAVSAAQEALKVKRILNEIREERITQAVALPMVAESPAYTACSCTAQGDIQALRDELNKLTDAVLALKMKQVHYEDDDVRPVRHNSPKARLRSPVNRYAGNVTPDNQVRCYECEGRGHVARECPTRINRRKKSEN